MKFLLMCAGVCVCVWGGRFEHELSNISLAYLKLRFELPSSSCSPSSHPFKRKYNLLKLLVSCLNSTCFCCFLLGRRQGRRALHKTQIDITYRARDEYREWGHTRISQRTFGRNFLQPQASFLLLCHEYLHNFRRCLGAIHTMRTAF